MPITHTWKIHCHCGNCDEQVKPHHYFNNDGTIIMNEPSLDEVEPETCPLCDDLLIVDDIVLDSTWITGCDSDGDEDMLDAADAGSEIESEDIGPCDTLTTTAGSDSIGEIDFDSEPCWECMSNGDDADMMLNSQMTVADVDASPQHIHAGFDHCDQFCLSCSLEDAQPVNNLCFSEGDCQQCGRPITI